MINYGEESSKKEGCGIAGIALTQGRAALPLYYALYALQHRGQESAGIAVSSDTEEDEGPNDIIRGGGEDIRLIKGMGFVYDVFSPQRLESLEGNIGIGHVRYSTDGTSKEENTEPLLVNYRKGKIAIALNGSLVNAAELRRELEREGRIFLTDANTEVIAQLLAKELMRHTPIDALSEVMRRVIGSYSMVILINNTVIAVRDPLGIKPLCIGEIKNGDDGTNAGYVIASESPAIDTLGGVLLRDVRPGEVLMLNPSQGLPSRSAASKRESKLESHQLCRMANSAHCVFEYVYFARPDSIIDEQLVYDARMRIGARLAEEHGVEADLVSPVPDSGITAAIGYAKRSGIDYMESFIKNRYVGRTFIMPEQSTRDLAVQLKLNVVRANVEGKRIVLVDDSIVRGTTSRIIVKYLKKKGAKEVHLRIGSPPLIAPCYLGIDTPTRNELVAWERNIDEITTFLNADSVRYLSIEGLMDAVGIAERNLCLGCLTGKYPVEIPGEMSIARQLRLSQFER